MTEFVANTLKTDSENNFLAIIIIMGLSSYVGIVLVGMGVVMGLKIQTFPKKFEAFLC